MYKTQNWYCSKLFYEQFKSLKHKQSKIFEFYILWKYHIKNANNQLQPVGEKVTLITWNEIYSKRFFTCLGTQFMCTAMTEFGQLSVG